MNINIIRDGFGKIAKVFRLDFRMVEIRGILKYTRIYSLSVSGHCFK